MKKYIIIAFSFLLFACKTPTETEPKVDITNNDIKAEKVITVGVGEFCGGPEKVSCKAGLQCKMDPNSTDNSGTCEDTVVDRNIVCSKEQKPVCGLRDGNKNGYLNECEAKRHGAEVLHEGLCKFDKSVEGNCAGNVLGMEGCAQNIRGFEFDGTRCVEKTVQGCRAEIPFKTQNDCENSCMNTTNSSPESTLIQDCPEEKIINKMPSMGTSAIPKTYFIYKKIRHEIAEFDAEYLEKNCDVKETIVQ